MEPTRFEPVDFDPFADPSSAASALPSADPSTDPFADPSAPVPGVPAVGAVSAASTAAGAPGTGTAWPLTSMQRELVAAVQMSPEAHAAFNLIYVLHLAGPLDADAMDRALQATVQRHGALRARLLPLGQGQVIEPGPVGALERLDLSALPDDEQTAAVQDLAEHHASETFDLERAPLWRAQLLRCAAQRHLLLFNVHHLVFDGWSSSVFFADLAQAYRADRFGVEPAWPAAVRYEDYLTQQASDDNRQLERSSMAYWLERHAQPAAPLALPLDRPRPAFKTFACCHVQRALPDELARAVRQLGARQGCTAFVTLMAAVQALVARLAGTQDVVLGVPMAVQTTLEASHLVGDGAQTVPLRCAVDVDAPFTDQLRAARQAVLAAQTHLHCSFGLLVRPLQLPRDPSRTPLVDVLFNMDRAGPPPDFGDLRLERLETPKRFSNAELSFNVLDDGRTLTLEVHHLSALYDGATLGRWLAALERALARWVEDPSLPLAEAFVPAGDEAVLLATFNATDLPRPAVRRLEQQFADQAARTPDAPALWSEGQPYSYAMIDAWANGVAQSLSGAGVRTGDRVGVACGRGPQTLVAVLGSMKAGAAYVPLDMAYPPARLKSMVDDAGVRVALCDAEAPLDLPGGGLACIALQACASLPQAPALALSAGDAAYVIFTSGSTGRPKGVAVSHAAVHNYLSSISVEPGITAGDRMAAVTTLSFDMSVTELFLPMMVGASVVMVSREDVREGRRLARRLADSGATVMQAAPSIWRLWLQGLAAVPDAAVPLRAWCGGEPLTAALATELLSRCAEVWNFYGPTETAVFSVIGRVSAHALSPVKVGRPIANTQVQVLDDRLRPLPLGAVGEIGIAGAGVAIGYWGRDELTAQRFVADPVRPGQRLYRTGDLGRWHADGTLECLGRLDHQVKLRGHRIELGEIEGALGACGVLESAVSVYAPAGQEPALVAHVVLPPQPGTGDAERLRALREQLRLRLPDVMLPTHWVALPQLPLLPNGKVNRHALPPPARSEPLELDAAPLTERQQTVAAIWRRHLGLGAGAPLQTQDNFFDLGGHSLLAAQVSADMEAALGWRVGVPRLVMESLGQLAQSGAPLEPPPAERAGALAGWMRRWGARR